MNNTTESAADGSTTVDLLVVGSGGGALTAALSAAAQGARVLVIEKLPVLGGSTAISGGALWIPDNPLMRKAGRADSFDAAWTYLDGLVGDCGPATSSARKLAFLTKGPAMVRFLLEQGVALKLVPQYPDYYTSRPGGHAEGRSLEAETFDGHRLGSDFARLNKRTLMPALPVRAQDLARVSNGFRTWHSTRTHLSLAGRMLAARLAGHAPLTMGMALVAHLLHAAQRQRVTILSRAPMQRLLTDPAGRVVGARVLHEGHALTVRARRGVLLAAGGFAHDAAMRARHRPQLQDDWSHASPGDEGDAIRAGLDIGAAVAQMDEAWWMPTSVMADGSRHMCAYERCKPHSIIVDQVGDRLCNECGSYMEIGQRILQRERERGSAVPCWLVFDARHRRHYPFGTFLAGHTPRSAIDSGYLRRAETLEALAEACGIDAAGLLRTVQRFNEQCATGRDDDYQRGDDPFDRYYGDPRVMPNPTMGTLERAPFYAVALYPGDIGTNGGLLTDEHARVLRDNGSPIAGLYATGNCTASVMGRHYPGAGATIGPSMVFGYVGARHAMAEPHIELTPQSSDLQALLD